MKKRIFMTFSGDNYYPLGGMNEFHLSFESKKEAEEFLKNTNDGWTEISEVEICLETGKISVIEIFE